MPVKMPAAADLEPIERAGRDELQALQLQRLQWTLKQAYQNVLLKNTLEGAKVREMLNRRYATAPTNWLGKRVLRRLCAP